LFAFGLASTANAQNPDPVIPTIEVGSIDIRPHGWTWTTIGTDREDELLSMARLRVTVETETPFDAFVEFDVTRGLDGDQNWLRQAYVTYTPSENVTVRAGRLFLAAPMVTPPPFLLRTADYMRTPFSAFAWGVQIQARVGDGVNLVADVTANSRSRFNESKSFNGIESSGRLTYDVNERLQVGGTYQVSGDFQRFAGDVTWRPTERHLLNAAVYKTFGDRPVTGGFAFYSYRVGNGVEPHVQLDYQHGAEDPFLATVGVRFNHDRFQLIGDVTSRGEILARFQVRF
jgi:hypothetical protein